MRGILLLCLLVLAACERPTDDPRPPYRWEYVGKGDFSPRDGAGLISFRDRLYMLGGWNPSDQEDFPERSNNEIWVSQDPDEDSSWDRIRKAAEWEPRHSFGLVRHSDGRLYVIGGDAQQGYYQNDVWDSKDGVTFRRLTHDAPWGPRVLHLTASFKGKLWVFGGQTLSEFAVDSRRGEDTLYRDAWSSVDGISWTKEADNLPFLPRGLIDRLVVHNGYLWAIGGGTYRSGAGSATSRNDVWRSSDGVTWKRVLAHAPWPPRRYASVETHGRRLWVVSGISEDNRNLADTWTSVDGVRWAQVESPFAPRHAAGLASHKGTLYLVSGNNFESDIWALRKVRRRCAALTGFNVCYVRTD